jgi:hypothetical protein
LLVIVDAHDRLLVSRDHEHQKLAESTASWLMTLRECTAEVEEGTKSLI